MEWFTHKVAKRIPLFTHDHTAYRVDWVKSNRCRDWEKVVFSYEMSIWLAGGRVCVCVRMIRTSKPSTKHS